jgi:hypothetical protein
MRQITLCIGAFMGAALAAMAAAAAPRPELVFSCSPRNDLYQVLGSITGRTAPRCDAPADAIASAPEGAGVLLLADGYPEKTTSLDPALLEAAARKKVRLFVEYPSWLPDVTLGEPQSAGWKRAVVISDAFGPELPVMRILMLHDCRFLPARGPFLPAFEPFVPARTPSPHLVLARVAGYDTAVFGLPGQIFPLLFELPATDAHGPVLLATTAFSRFVTARFGPTDAWKAVWLKILGWLSPGSPPPELAWTPPVRPSHGRLDTVTPEGERNALERGVEWFTKSKLLLHPSREPEVLQRADAGILPPPAADEPVGDGERGMLEGYLSRIQPDGSQFRSLARRGDCTGEAAMALAFGGKVLGHAHDTVVARNLLDFWYFTSDACKRERGDPRHGAYGLIAWGLTTPGWYASNFGDDNARLLLGTLAVAALTGDDRWDEAVLRCLLANLRTTGQFGFRSDCLVVDQLGTLGWRHFFNRRITNFAPHYESYLWACYLWAWQKTKFDLFRRRSEIALRMTMDAYPADWRWTNGMQQERARMLLPLAWLVRVDDTREHRAWMRRLAADLVALQDESGALREEIGALERGQLKPPQSNEAYGAGETSLLQRNGDPVCDLLYTSNFALLGLHEAAAATGDDFYRQAEDKLASFLARIQIRSDDHPELDGGWFRGFDFKRWEYWASNGDIGWGAWCIESGWTQGWIVSVLALRQMKTSLWDLTAGSRIDRHLPSLRPLMIPDDALVPPSITDVRHAAVGKPVELGMPYSTMYPGTGSGAVTDGIIGGLDYRDPAWQGYWQDDLVATIDLGQPIPLAELSARFLQTVNVGIFLPVRVEFAAGDERTSLKPISTVHNDVPVNEAGPLIRSFSVRDLGISARFVRVRAVNVGSIPAGHPAAGAKAWLFVDEIVVNPAGGGSEPALRR